MIGHERVAAVVPMRHSSERVPGKNYRAFAGVPLYAHIVSTLLQVAEIDQVVIDTDSETILADAERRFPSVTLVERPADLRDGATSMNLVLANTLQQIDATTILQTHSTNPLLTRNTISGALHAYTEDIEEFDSVFGVTRLQARLWTPDFHPLNHELGSLLRTQDLPPVYLENSTFYIFSPTLLTQTGSRVGKRPRLVEVPPLEAIDIDEESDFLLAEAVHHAGLVGA